MATSRYEVEYADGRSRVKQFTPEDAERHADMRGIKSVKKQPASKQARTPAQQKGE